MYMGQIANSILEFKPPPDMFDIAQRAFRTAADIVHVNDGRFHPISQQYDSGCLSQCPTYLLAIRHITEVRAVGHQCLVTADPFSHGSKSKMVCSIGRVGKKICYLPLRNCRGQFVYSGPAID